MREMKDSGIEWIGKVPVEWKIDNPQYHFSQRKDRAKQGMVQLTASQKYGVITQTEYMERTGANIVTVQKDFDILVRDGQAMRWSNFIQLPILFPPAEEQQRIADFLDAKCAEIDALTADIQTQIDTLEQYKRSVITETVTKGLNPDAEMKDSGIEWVGEIPAHWLVHPVYYYYGERKNKNYLGKEDNLLSLSYGRVVRKDINTSDGLLPESFNTYNIVETGDIIIRPTDLQNDKRSLRTGLVKEHGIITSAYIDLCPIKQVDSRYFYFLLQGVL